MNELLILSSEWEQLVGLVHPGVRRLTLVPFDAAAAAAVKYGNSAVTIDLLKQLEILKPPSWADEVECKEFEKGRGEGEGDDDDYDDDDDIGVEYALK